MYGTPSDRLIKVSGAAPIAEDALRAASAEIDSALAAAGYSIPVEEPGVGADTELVDAYALLRLRAEQLAVPLAQPETGRGRQSKREAAEEDVAREWLQSLRRGGVLLPFARTGGGRFFAAVPITSDLDALFDRRRFLEP